MSRRIGVVTTSRADFGILRPVLEEIGQTPDLELSLIVGGSQSSDVVADYPVAVHLPKLVAGEDRPAAISAFMGATTAAMGAVLEELKLDLLFVMGDRFEMHAAAVASVPFNLPLAHLHGGELTYGAIDEVFRHSMSKMAHLHFAATDDDARRLRQMGEEPWRITVSGAPSLDNLTRLAPMSLAELEAQLGVGITPETLLVTLHSETRAAAKTKAHVAALVSALEAQALPVIATRPNADTGGQIILDALSDLAGRCDHVQVFDSLGTRAYFCLMSHAAAMVGNSSSGLIEASSFKLPVINIGDRQKGRTRAANVIDVAFDARAIDAAVKRGVSEDFRRGLDDLTNPYGDGKSAQRIVRRLCEVCLDDRLIYKEFAQS